MAITSRTAAARAQPQHPTVGGEMSDPFFQFIDFTFSDEEDENNRPVMDITEAASSIGGFQSFAEFPSPIPLREINFNDQTNTSMHPASTDTGQQTKADVIAPNASISSLDYDAGPNKTTCPKPEDVLSVRGVGHSKNPGNLRFRELVNSKKSSYDRNTSPEFRKSLAVDIVAQLNPGRFLKKTDSSQRSYHIMDFEASVTKALFAIRDVKPGASRPKSSALVKGKRKRKAPASKFRTRVS
jgi:hypothetical protein